jgi:hypothetical protein
MGSSADTLRLVGVQRKSKNRFIDQRVEVVVVFATIRRRLVRNVGICHVVNVYSVPASAPIVVYEWGVLKFLSFVRELGLRTLYIGQIIGTRVHHI